MKTYLITGAAGFIGANFLKYILKKYEDIKVIVVDLLTYAGNLGTIKEELKDNRVKFEKALKEKLMKELSIKDELNKEDLKRILNNLDLKKI